MSDDPEMASVQSPLRTSHLLGKFGACNRCAWIAYSGFLISLLIASVVILLTEEQRYHLSFQVIVVIFTVLSAMHLVGRLLKTHSSPTASTGPPRDCGCVPGDDEEPYSSKGF